ncbi:MAG: cytochrome c [Saprospiraceae bacterium]|nr:cytochrome c [Saprospiraceae bacterium]MCB9325726.1 cytochrome c [Lewinellaceae bacterium]
MKKVLKIVGIIIGSIVLILAIAAAYINFSPMPTYEVKAPQISVTTDSASVAEGRRMAQMVCFQCHMNGNQLEGKIMEEDTPFGNIWAPNITQDKEHGIGQYTDGELAWLLRTGIKRNGGYAPPWMPKFPHLSDQDLNNIIAYLRSDSEEVQPSDKSQPANEPTFLTKLLVRVAFKPLPYDGKPISAPPITDKVAYGRYLATAKIDCFGCHSPDFKTQNILEPEKTPGYFSGGNKFEEESGIVYSANLTPDEATGIGSWTEDQFIQMVKFGRKPDGTSARSPMPPFAQLTDEEASSLWAYLQTLPAVSHDVKRMYETE